MPPILRTYLVPRDKRNAAPDQLPPPERFSSVEKVDDSNKLADRDSFDTEFLMTREKRDAQTNHQLNNEDSSRLEDYY